MSDIAKIVEVVIKAAEYGAKYGDNGVEFIKNVMDNWDGEVEIDWEALESRWEKTPDDYLAEAGVIRD